MPSAIMHSAIMHSLYVFFFGNMYNMPNAIDFKFTPMNYLCLPKVGYSRVQTGNNNPMVSRRMRYSQIATATNLRGHRRTVIGLDRIPLDMRPTPAVIVPLSNFP
jgi:hypothetical protein